jgi:hypothetical protein
MHLTRSWQEWLVVDLFVRAFFKVRKREDIFFFKTDLLRNTKQAHDETPSDELSTPS